MNYVTWLKAICCLEIFFLHYFAGHDMREWMWIFNGAVPCFLLVSAFIYGERPETKRKFDKSWLKKRLKKLSYTYYPFVTSVFLYFAFTCDNIKELSLSYIFSLTYLPVIYKPLPSCGHLWFLTTLIACYLLIFVLYRYNSLYRLLIKPKMLFLFLLTILVIGGGNRNAIFVHLFFYAFVYGYSDVIKLYSRKTPLWLMALVLVMLYALLSFQYRDLFYYGIYIEYFHTCLIAILTIMITLRVLQQQARTPKVITWLSSMSMSIYLIHHLFVYDQPLYISLPVTLLLSIILNYVSNKIKRQLGKGGLAY